MTSTTVRSRGPILLYAAEDEGGGRWVTIGAKQGEGDEKHGGTPVYIKDGTIVKGPRALKGRKVAHLGAKGKQEASGHRDRANALRHAADSILNNKFHDADRFAHAKKTAAERRAEADQADAEADKIEGNDTPAAESNDTPELPTGVADFLKRSGLKAVPMTEPATVPKPDTDKAAATLGRGLATQPDEPRLGGGKIRSDKSEDSEGSALPRYHDAKKRYEMEQGHKEPHKRQTFDEAIQDLVKAGGKEKDLQWLIDLYAPPKEATMIPFQSAA